MCLTERSDKRPGGARAEAERLEVCARVARRMERMDRSRPTYASAAGILSKAISDEALDRELRYYFERLVRDLIDSGCAPEDARRRARIEFGAIEQVSETCRDVWIR